MKSKTPAPENDDMRPEYDFDFSKGERGRYFKRLQKEGSNNIVLEPDVAKVFPNSAAVNDALRSLLTLLQSTTSLTRRSTRTPRKRIAG